MTKDKISIHDVLAGEQPVDPGLTHHLIGELRRNGVPARAQDCQHPLLTGQAREVMEQLRE